MVGSAGSGVWPVVGVNDMPHPGLAQVAPLRLVPGESSLFRDHCLHDPIPVQVVHRHSHPKAALRHYAPLAGGWPVPQQRSPAACDHLQPAISIHVSGPEAAQRVRFRRHTVQDGQLPPPRWIDAAAFVRHGLPANGDAEQPDAHQSPDKHRRQGHRQPPESDDSVRDAGLYTVSPGQATHRAVIDGDLRWVTGGCAPQKPYPGVPRRFPESLSRYHPASHEWGFDLRVERRVCPGCRLRTRSLCAQVRLGATAEGSARVDRGRTAGRSRTEAARTSTHSQAKVGDVGGLARSKPQPWRRGADHRHDRTWPQQYRSRSLQSSRDADGYLRTTPHAARVGNLSAGRLLQRSQPSRAPTRRVCPPPSCRILKPSAYWKPHFAPSSRADRRRRSAVVAIARVSSSPLGLP